MDDPNDRQVVKMHDLLSQTYSMRRGMLISYHNLVTCTLPVTKKEKEIKEISYRHYGSIDIKQFKKDFLQSELARNYDSTADIDELVSCFNVNLRSLLRTHAPTCKRLIRPRPRAPWHNPSVAKARVQMYRSERKYNKTGYNLNKAEFHRTQNFFSKTKELAIQQHVQKRIDDNSVKALQNHRQYSTSNQGKSPSRG